MKPLLAFAPLAAASLIAAVPVTAAAMPIFPMQIEKELMLDYQLGTNHCDICHNSPTGGDQVIHPFGLAMIKNGLGADGLGSIPDALHALEAQGVDSDCNNETDIQQLKDGRNPNPPGDYIDGSGRTAPADNGCAGFQPVGFGCQAQLAAGLARWEGALVLAPLALFAVAHRRRRRARPRGSITRAR